MRAEGEAIQKQSRSNPRLWIFFLQLFLKRVKIFGGFSFLYFFMAMRQLKNRILMIGWEYPPFNSGGLGVACKNLAESLAQKGFEITFTLPYKMEVSTAAINFYFAKADFRQITNKMPYFFSYAVSPPISAQAQSFIKTRRRIKTGNSLIDMALLYRDELLENFDASGFDLIYAHDWLTLPAAVALKHKYNKPLIVHIHALEFDRAGEDGWRYSPVALIEREGLQEADKIIAVSHYTKNRIISCYKIPADKISVVHNAIQSTRQEVFLDRTTEFFKNKKIVLFVGRLTLQKGIDWFLKAAQQVAIYEPDVLFIIVGDGELKGEAVKLAAQLGIARRVIFTGFLRGKDLAKVYQMADLFILSSVSEPFGITPLEALKYGTPVIISRNSGVKEVIKGALVADFWDTQRIAEKILAVLRYHPLKKKLTEDGGNDLKNISWDKAAEKVEGVFGELLHASP